MNSGRRQAGIFQQAMDNIISLSGSIKSLEKRFLTADVLTRAVQARSFGEFATLLAEGWYRLPQTLLTAEDLTEFFEGCTAELVDEMRRDLPLDIYHYFVLEYDYHNIELLIHKDRYAVEREKDYFRHSSVDYFTLKTSLENNNYKDIPEHLKDVLYFVHNNISAEGLSLSLKRMYYRTVRELLKSAGSDFIDKYLSIEIDFFNIGTFIQQKIAGIQFGKTSFIDGGNIKVERFAVENVLWESVGKRYRNVSVPITLQNYDTARYTAVMNYIKEGRFIPYGIETVFTYFVGRRLELDNVRRLAIGKFYGVDPKVLSDWVLPPYQCI